MKKFALTYFHKVMHSQKKAMLKNKALHLANTALWIT